MVIVRTRWASSRWTATREEFSDFETVTLTEHRATVCVATVGGYMYMCMHMHMHIRMQMQIDR